MFEAQTEVAASPPQWLLALASKGWRQHLAWAGRPPPNPAVMGWLGIVKNLLSIGATTRSDSLASSLLPRRKHQGLLGIAARA